MLLKTYLRPYQQRAVDASIQWMRKSVDPFLIEAATGAGKSHIIADVAHQIHSLTGKRVLCLAPSAELVTQNRAKYLANGFEASMFSASAGAKELRHPVVFGSPLTVKNRISRFCQSGEHGYALVVIDECHGITPTVRSIINEMRKANPNLRVMGLTATPYRLGTGYIFAMWPDQTPTLETHEPYFTACVDRIDAHELIELGYLTPPIIGSINAGAYDTATLSPNARGKFDAADVDKAYHGHGRLTASIVADVVEQARDRKGVMFFAATVRHAQEVMASLPAAMSEIVTGETKAKDRQDILRRFKAQEIKYLVNVSVLTTGFDAPHVDCIAILRKTESVGLLQQIIGRGLRLDAGKADCLVLDYTTNIADHCPDGDLFSPKIKSGYASGGDGMPFQCPTCEGVNHFTPRGDYLDAESNFTVPVDPAGYVLDINGHQVKVDGQPMPVHFGRRCMCLVQIGPRGEWDRCAYRWTYKPCPECDAENDIAARYCVKCRAEIVDPNERLVSDFIAKKKDPHNLQTDLVMSIAQRAGVSRSGNRTERLDIVTPHRSFSVWLMPDSMFAKGQRQWAEYQNACEGETLPRTVTYRKNLGTGFYEVLGWNRPEDKMPDVEGEKYAAQ